MPDAPLDPTGGAPSARGSFFAGDDAPTTAAELASYIDHTLLKPEANRAQIERLCAEAVEWSVYSVCVNSVWVETAGKLLAGSPVAVCAVVGFPLGAMVSSAKAYEAAAAIEVGAREIDMVLDIGAIKSGDYARAQADIALVARATHAGAARLKVILETALLDDAEKTAVGRLAVAAGADFVKTSTGFGPGGATTADVRLLRDAVGPRTGVKASGGIRTLDAALAMIAAGADRLGLSGTVAILTEARGRDAELG